MVFTIDNLRKMSWESYEKYLNKIESDIRTFCKEKSLHIDFICPILRGGGTLGIGLAYKLSVLRIMPIQIKYMYYENKVKTKILLNTITDIKDKEREYIVLLVEGNHCTGKTSNEAINIIKSILPSAKIIYVSLGRDYQYRNSVTDVIFDTYAFYTNESLELPAADCEKMKIENKITIYPWETVEEELNAMNNVPLSNSYISDSDI